MPRLSMRTITPLLLIVAAIALIYQGQALSNDNNLSEGSQEPIPHECPDYSQYATIKQ